tara:strand:- start:992 stop:1123 length:132 start_codon:yes stop_codon:yes gene_type:complete
MRAIKNSKYLDIIRKSGAGLLLFFAVKGAIYTFILAMGYLYIS